MFHHPNVLPRLALQETLEFVKQLSDYVDGETDTPPTPSLKKGVLVDIRLTREIEKWYSDLIPLIPGD